MKKELQTFEVTVTVVVDMEAWRLEYGWDAESRSEMEAEVKSDLIEWSTEFVRAPKWDGLAFYASARSATDSTPASEWIETENGSDYTRAGKVVGSVTVYGGRHEAFIRLTDRFHGMGRFPTEVQARRAVESVLRPA